MFRLKINTFILCLHFCFFQKTALALPADNAEAFHINANSWLMNVKSGLNSYEGDVKVIQGTTHLLADRVTTQKNAQHKIEEAVAYGDTKPAEYWTIPKAGDTTMHAQAKIIKFYPLKSTVILEDNVIVTQGENSFHGPMIVYNIKDQTISAPATPKGRSTIVIEAAQLK
jgi:lipopolysaccharide export system protein LptA